MGTAKNVWQWQQQDACVPSGARAPTDGVWSQCPPLGAFDVIGAASDACSQTPSGARPLPPLEPEITVVICLHLL